MRPEGETVMERTLDGGPYLRGKRRIHHVSSPFDDREKFIAEEDDETSSDMDLDDLRMIDEGLTQLEVRMDGGSRTITIPMDRDLLRNTEEVVLALGPLCSDAEGETLKKITDNTLSKNIAGLALRVNTIVILPFPFALAYF